MKTVVPASCSGVYTAVDRSDLLALDVATVVEAIDWS